jgi:hypothetical protein
MREYRPSGLIPLTGIVLLAAAALIGGVGLGLIVHFVARQIYLIILFPIFLGLAAGFIVAVAAQAGKVRAPLIAGLFGVILVAILYGVYWYADYYLLFRGDLRDEIEQSFGEITDEEYQQFEDTALDVETGSKGFVGYIKLTAQEGITLTRATSSSDSGLTLKDMIAYIYWAVEFLIMAYLGFIGAYRSGQQPFSEETGQWFGKPTYVGTLNPVSIPALVEHLQQGQLEQAGALLSPIASQPPRYDIVVYDTGAPGADVMLALQALTVNRSNVEAKDRQRWMLPQAEFERLKRGIPIPPPPDL